MKQIKLNLLTLALSLLFAIPVIGQTCTAEAGTLTHSGPNPTCSGNGIPDIITFQPNGVVAENYKIVFLTNDLITKILPGLSYDFDGELGGTQVCGIAYNGTLTNLEVGKRIGQLSGCFDVVHLGIFITVFHVSPGTITTKGGRTDTTVCVSNGINDVIDPKFTNAFSFGFLFVTTDVNGIVLAQSMGGFLNLEGTGAGTVKLWVIGSCFEGIEIAIGASVFDLPPTQKLSNAITVTKTTGCSGGGQVCAPEVKSCPGKVLMCVNNVSTCVDQKQVNKLLKQGAKMGGCIRCTPSNSAFVSPGSPKLQVYEKEVKIYPNPSNGSNLNIEMLAGLSTQIQILDLNGRKVWAYQADLTVPQVSIFRVDAVLKPGIYFVYVNSDTSAIVKKVVVQ